jgi:hypothetical protein
MIVGQIAMALFVDMTHLNKTMIRIAIKLPRRLAISNQLSHPWIIGACRGKEFLHERGDLEGQLGIFAVAPYGTNLGNVSIQGIALPCFLYGHMDSPFD